jgi:glycosyltransferase involved in cell wall biosynthesis
MKVLFVVEHFYPYVGGAEELFLNLSLSLVKNGIDVEIITTRHDKTLAKREEYNGIKIRRVHCYNRFLFTVFSFPYVLKRARKADVIHTASYNSAPVSFLAGFFLRKKVVITFHEVWGKLWLQLPFTSKWLLMCFYYYEKFILKLPFHKYIAVSDATKKALIKNGIQEEKIVRIYNGVNYPELKGYSFQPTDKFTFCYFGRLGISKGLDILLNATKKFIAENRDSTLKLILPDYPQNLYRKILNLIQENNLNDKIILLQNLSREKLLQEISTTNCVVIPSWSEGFCFVAAESAGIGIPIISSGKGSLPEVVSGKYILMEQMNATSLYNALEQAKKNNWVSKPLIYFSREETISHYLRLYNSL